MKTKLTLLLTLGMLSACRPHELTQNNENENYITYPTTLPIRLCVS